MPIYAYRCTACGHSQDVLQKLSDSALSVCPACGASAFAKQLTAAGFQLKGSGWYATDFKGAAAGKKPDDAAPAKEATPTDKPGDSAKPGKSDSAGSPATPEPKSAAAAGCSSGCACH
jgi:putative FmdB family regulatory protein